MALFRRGCDRRERSGRTAETLALQRSGGHRGDSAEHRRHGQDSGGSETRWVEDLSRGSVLCEPLPDQHCETVWRVCGEPEPDAGAVDQGGGSAVQADQDCQGAASYTTASEGGVTMAEHVCKTAFGSVNAVALEHLQESFETQRLLDAVDQVDHIAELANDGSFRRNLLRLHSMAHTIINGAPRTASSKERIWELAGDLALELEDVVEDLHSTLGLLHQLAELAPEFADEGGADG